MTFGRITRRRLLAGAGAAGMAVLPAFNQRAAANFPAAGDVIGRLDVYKLGPDETMLEVARRFALGFTELMTANTGIDPWIPGPGTAALLPSAHVLPDAPREGIVINLAEQRLYYYPQRGGVQTYPIGIGRDGLQTPLGTTRITHKRVSPIWRPTARMRQEDPTLPAVVGPGPDNPLGDYAMYLGWPLYLIHGTNKPWGIGRRVSSGCIRMYPEGIESLFSQVRIGIPVTVLDQPFKVGWSESELYLEVHPSQQQADQLEMHGRFRPEDVPGFVLQVVGAAGNHADRLDWATITRATYERTGVPVQITWSPVTSPAIDAEQLSARRDATTEPGPAAARSARRRKLASLRSNAGRDIGPQPTRRVAQPQPLGESPVVATERVVPINRVQGEAPTR